MSSMETKILKYFNNILDQAQTGIVITDPYGKENPLVYVNKYFEEMFGYEKDEVLGKNCRFLQKDDRDQESIKLMREAIKSQKSITTIVRNYTKDGTLLYNEVTISPIYDENDKLVFFLGIQKDITDNQILLSNIKDIIT